MNTLPIPAAASASPLRQRLIADMTMRRFSSATQRNYIRDVRRLASFLGRPPDTANVEDLRRFQFAVEKAGLGAALLLRPYDRPADLAHKLVRLP